MVTSHLETTKKSDRTFWLEEDFFLRGTFDVAIDAHLKACLLAILPEHGQVQSLNKDVVAAKALTTGDVVQAQKQTLVKELTSATNLLVDVLEHRAPSSVEASKLSEFAMKVL